MGHGTIMPVTVEIRRGSARFVTKAPGRSTHHSFSFGEHYDPERLGFGPMVCHDDHLLGSGQGFELHSHADLEIISWVLSGALVHTDSTGAETTVSAGSVAVLKAGSGVEHSEVAATGVGPTRFVQVWLRAEQPGTTPSYDVSTPVLTPNELVEVARPQSGSVLSVARLDDGATLVLPHAPKLHVFVASGALVRSSMAEPLSPGDAFVMTDEPDHRVTAAVPTVLLVWSLA